MSDRQLLAGFGVSGFRSFGSPEIQRVGPMGVVHLLAGPNNAGKSNLARALQRTVTTLRQGERWKFESSVDAPLASHVPLRVAIGLNRTRLDQQLAQRQTSNVDDKKALLDCLTESDGIVWFEFDPNGNDSTKQIAPEILQRVADNAPDSISDFVPKRVPRPDPQPGDLVAGAGRAVESLLTSVGAFELLPKASRIPAGRSLRDIKETTEAGAPVPRNGFGLIDELAKLQDPPHLRFRDRERFDAINRFIRELFNDPDASLRVPFQRDTLVVYHEGHHLPLSSFGSGLQQVVILATAATVLSDELVCIEEPEVHLHPTLQRLLLRYLRENTSNQYLIATHSAHMLDANVASITTVTKEDGHSRTEATIEPRRLFELSALLGARASDLVQTNAVIWVEGPSDRTYINGWIRRIDDDLIEGAHYSIMFYGGSTLSHLGTESEASGFDRAAAEAIIELPVLNRNMAIVIDSDREAEADTIGETKERIKQEFEEHSAPVWITKGYTIENYIPADLFEAAIRTVHPQQEYVPTSTPFENPLGADRFPQNRKFRATKAKLAVEVMDKWGDRELPHDVAYKISELVRFVRSANDLKI